MPAKVRLSSEQDPTSLGFVEPISNRLYARGTGVPNPIDVIVGKRIRVRRLLLGMTQETLAGALGVTFQRVQKYELGTNRVSASRLAAIGDALRVPISYFFGDVRSDHSAQTLSQPIPIDLMDQPQTIELVRLYCAIHDEGVRSQALEIVKAISEASAPPSGTAGHRRKRAPQPRPKQLPPLPRRRAADGSGRRVV